MPVHDFSIQLSTDRYFLNWLFMYKKLFFEDSDKIIKLNVFIHI